MYLHRKIHHSTGMIFQISVILSEDLPDKVGNARNNPSTPESRGHSFCLISTFTWRVLSPCPKY